MSKYMFRFTRRRKRASILIALLFVIYQLIIHFYVSNSVLNGEPFKSPVYIENKNLVRGVRPEEIVYYTPDKWTFKCLRSGEVIDFSKVNDNYCDCKDSTDEPGTNACPDGYFYCPLASSNKKYPKMVPSSKVNDGICDCCDGSEEYENNNVFHHSDSKVQSKMDNILVLCPNMC